MLLPLALSVAKTRFSPLKINSPPPPPAPAAIMLSNRFRGIATSGPASPNSARVGEVTRPPSASAGILIDLMALLNKPLANDPAVAAIGIANGPNSLFEVSAPDIIAVTPSLIKAPIVLVTD